MKSWKKPEIAELSLSDTMGGASGFTTEQVAYENGYDGVAGVSWYVYSTKPAYANLFNSYSKS